MVSPVEQFAARMTKESSITAEKMNKAIDDLGPINIIKSIETLLEVELILWESKIEDFAADIQESEKLSMELNSNLQEATTHANNLFIALQKCALLHEKFNELPRLEAS